MASYKTGITGLDDMLGGGIPEGKTILLLAPPGTGKTTICKRFAAETTSEKRKLVYIATGYSFDEFKEEMKKAGVEHCPQDNSVHRRLLMAPARRKTRTA